MTVSHRFVVVVALFITCLIAANIMIVKQVSVGALVLPAAIVIFPLNYIIGDVLTEVYGYLSLRRVREFLRAGQNESQDQGAVAVDENHRLHPGGAGYRYRSCSDRCFCRSAGFLYAGYHDPEPLAGENGLRSCSYSTYLWRGGLSEAKRGYRCL